MSKPFDVVVSAERSSIPTTRTTLWCALRIEPTGAAMEAQRAPIALALVLDVSGSMGGEPIAQVIKASELLVDLLDEGDELAVVTFSQDAKVQANLRPCTEARRAEVKRRVRAIDTGGGTNVEAGLRTAGGVLGGAREGLRRAMVLLSDGQPNAGLRTAAELGAYARSLRPCAVSTLGFGLHHDELVLAAIARDASGRYAYVPDPVLARVDLARAAMAHASIVADRLELVARPAEGVEIVRVLPVTQLRHGGQGVRADVGDVLVDEGRVLAIELSIEPSEQTRGRLVDFELTGRDPSGATHKVNASLTVDVHAGPHAIDRAAQRDVLLVRGDVLRGEARAMDDRGNAEAAAALLEGFVGSIDASEGFVRNDGTPLAELREQLVDEVASYRQGGTEAECTHRAKGAMTFSMTTRSRRGDTGGPAPGVLVGLDGDVKDLRFELHRDTTIGRSQDNTVVIASESLSRRHARIVYLGTRFLLQDLGSTNGCAVNELLLASRAEVLSSGDIVKLGSVRFRFESTETT